jgi:uncharacterized SAM-binding protein YcdF (DUF218 family)
VIVILLAVFIAAGRYLVYQDPLEPADVIVILSGNDESRVTAAAELYHQGYGANIMLTNTGNTFGEYNQPYSMLQKEQLQELGIPEGGIYIAEFQAKNTGQEATGIINKMYDLGFHSAIIVTDSWHTRRVKTIFSDSFSNTGFRFSVYPAPGSDYNKNFWWLTPSGWKDTVSEYIRLLGYYIKRDTNIPDYPNITL